MSKKIENYDEIMDLLDKLVQLEEEKEIVHSVINKLEDESECVFEHYVGNEEVTIGENDGGAYNWTGEEVLEDLNNQIDESLCELSDLLEVDFEPQEELYCSIGAVEYQRLFESLLESDLPQERKWMVCDAKGAELVKIYGNDEEDAFYRICLSTIIDHLGDGFRFYELTN